MSSQELRDHEMGDVFVCPVGEVARYASEERDVEGL